MNWNKHFNLIGKHAFLSASKYHWVNYDIDKLTSVYTRNLAVQRGNELHKFAQLCIELKQKLPRTRLSLNQYVNDATGYRMIPEQILFYSPNAFGTADTINFRNKLLRIHDLKTGKIPAHMVQLEIYAGLFCLEYDEKPNKIDIELRIYQNGKIIVHNPESTRIRDIMDKIIIFDKKIQEINTIMED